MKMEFYLIAVFFVVSSVFNANGFHRPHTYRRVTIGGSLFKRDFTANSKIIKVTQIKDEIVQLSKNSDNGTKLSKERKELVLGLVLQLEKLNKEQRIATSPDTVGNWKLIFTTNEGSSAGKIGPFVGSVFQDIKTEMYTNIVQLGSGAVEASLTANWDVKGRNLWQVNFQQLIFKLFGLKLLEKSLKGTSGIWRLTYLDSDFRILWAMGGKNTVKENVYVLSRVN